jgi:hypothetical protein
MSLAIILKATSAMVAEAKMDAIDMFVDYMREKIDIDDEFMQLIKEFKDTMKEDSIELAKPKKANEAKGVVENKRAPTAYHIFMRETSASLREEKPSMSKKEVQDEAKRLWKEKKAAEPVSPKAKGKKVAVSSDSEPVVEEDASSDEASVSADDNVIQRIKEAVEVKSKVAKKKNNTKKKITDMLDELTSDE